MNINLLKVRNYLQIYKIVKNYLITDTNPSIPAGDGVVPGCRDTFASIPAAGHTAKKSTALLMFQFGGFGVGGIFDGFGLNECTKNGGDSQQNN